MTDRWSCESAYHVGPRFEVHPMDRFTRRQTYMRADGKQRLHERSLDRICRSCIAKEMEFGQEGLF